MKTLIVTNRHNPCAICDDTSGDCRTSLKDSSYFQCHTYADAAKFEVVNGFKSIGKTTCGVWAQFKPAGRYEQPSDEVKEKQALANALKRQQVQAFNATRMPVAERDRHYQNILSQLTLEKCDRDDLLRRGFTDEQIRRYGFKSVSQWQALTGEFPLNLPGISKSGTNLDNWHEGYLCAATNAQGQIQGFQIRNRHYNGNGAKYPWLSRNERKNPNGYGAHLSDGKLPVGVYWPDELTVFDAVGLCEGFAVKPQAAANLSGMVVIGCDAANITSRADNFKVAVQETQQCLTGLKNIASTTSQSCLSKPLQLISSQYSKISDTLGKLSTSLTKANQGCSTTTGFPSSWWDSNTSIPVGESSIQAAQLGQDSTTLTPTTKTEQKSLRFGIVYIPDAGDVANGQVLSRIRLQFDTLKDLGLQAEILWWNQKTKADGDIDEISQQQFDAAKLITFQDFLAMAPDEAKPKPEAVTPAAPATAQKHWDYERPMTGIWGQVAESFDGLLTFKKESPALTDLLPEKMQAAMSQGKSVSSPQAIALKAYAAFLQKAAQHDYQAEAQALIAGIWDWSDIPERAPLWGWKGFLMAVAKHCDKSGKAALKACRDGLKKAVKDAKAAERKALADKWEMLPENVTWLETEFFGSAITDRVKAAGDQRSVLGVLGATGTGKTYSLNELRKWAATVGRQFIYGTVKETLARATGIALGLTYRLDLQVDDGTEKKQYPDLACCMASLIENARGIDWSRQVSSNAIVVLDEIDLLASTTGGEGAGSNALELQRVLAQVLQSAQTVIVMSAQVKSRHMKVIKNQSWINNAELIGIKRAAVKKSITIWDDSARPEELAEGDDRAPMEPVSLKNVMLDRRRDCLSDGKNVLTMTGAQKPDSKLGAMLLEQYDSQECGVTSVIRLDSQSTKDPDHAAYKIADQDYVAAFRSAQSAICSPSAQEGFSLEFGPLDGPSHFQNVFCFDPGNKLVEQLIQDIGRDRHATPTEILVAAGHTQKRFGGTVEPLDVRRQLKAVAEQKETKLLGIADNHGPRNWDNDWLAFYCEDVAQSNASLADKAYNLARYLEAIGHEVTVKTEADGYPCTGIPDDFYDRISKEHYHQPVAEAALISRFEAEEIQQSGKVTIQQWYQIQNLLFRQAMRWDTHHIVDEETGQVTQPENPHDNGVELDANFVRQWSRERIAKPWQMHFYAQQSEWDWLAYDFKKTRFAPRFENQNAQGNCVEDFTPNDIISLRSRRLSVLKELGLIDFLNQWGIDVADSEITKATSAKALAQELQDRHPESRFTKSALDSVVEKLKANFESTCELLGIKSQRNDDGGINHRQALTILRNVFQVKTFAITGRSLNGERGVYVLVADDRAQAFRKGLIKADKKSGEERDNGIEAAQELYTNTHNRTEMRGVWGKHLEVERAQFRKFLEEKSYKIDLLDAQRPDHWQSLSSYLAADEPDATEPTTEPTTTEAKATPLNEAEKILMFRLAYCQSFDEYDNIRNELETHCNDFDGRYWVLLPDESQQRICALPVPVTR